MTVLSQYDRLESPGLWRANDDAQRQNVFVMLGEATLVITNEQEVALSHWSLPALIRLNPGEMPAQYRPGDDSDEWLEIDDATMMDAIETVRGALKRRRPRQGRVRGLVRLSAVALMILFGVLWLPGALRKHSAAILPDAIQRELGEDLLRALMPMTGPPCTYSPSLAAADKLSDRLFGEDAPRIAVLSGGPVRTMALPGGTLLIHRDLIELPRSPEVPAGYLIAQSARAETLSPLVTLLDHASPWAVLKLLTTGQLPHALLADYAEALPLRPAQDPGDLGAHFAARAVDPAPYLFDLAAKGQPAPELRNSGHPTEPVLSDADWVRLQDICAR
ncbi:MAG: hypothetical protein OIF40_01560 [Mangrovicoccus sp.]|nr:hypothetical protein [Mangrovicoccus sp.]